MNDQLKEAIEWNKSLLKSLEFGPINDRENVKVSLLILQRVLDAGKGIDVEIIGDLIATGVDVRVKDGIMVIEGIDETAKVIHDLFTAQRTKESIELEELKKRIANAGGIEKREHSEGCLYKIEPRYYGNPAKERYCSCGAVDFNECHDLFTAYLNGEKKNGI